MYESEVQNSKLNYILYTIFLHIIVASNDSTNWTKYYIRCSLFKAKLTYSIALLCIYPNGLHEMQAFFSPTVIYIQYDEVKLIVLYIRIQNSKSAHTHAMGICNQCGCMGYALTQLVGCLNLSSILPLCRLLTSP